MNAIDFLSGEKYIVLPTKSNPKVYLSIDNKAKAKSAFELYNPFSKKAKVLKAVTGLLCINLNVLAKLIVPSVRGHKSKFVTFLEGKLDKKLTSSVYIATAKDKLVLQLQDANGILGYIKYPISSIGKQRLLNEQKAIVILSTLKLAPEILISDTYNEMPFILLENLTGTIRESSRQEYSSILQTLKKDHSFKLANHPRMLGLKNELKELKLVDTIVILDFVLSTSEDNYLEVYEHGDFAPWNLIRTAKGIVPFDFEYFEEQGLEHMDELKYHFQIESLLHHKKGMDLIDAVSSNVDIKEFALIFQIFLIKEIVNKHKAKEPYDLENQLLKEFGNGKA